MRTWVNFTHVYKTWLKNSKKWTRLKSVGHFGVFNNQLYT